ncbi:MAG TPA: SDR family NAD(P)-dependent oxidoreductase, partial [Anaerolineae bacterium]
SQARADGDHIYGVIRGSAENHGGRATSLTAPNPKAQAELLVKAYQEAGLDSETISYIETHGTGTALGDPIEIEGLKRAFEMLRNGQAPGKRNYCGLGAVKTNIGHLEPAAGIAGLFKVLLALRHQTLPATINFTEQNPYIDLTDSPFYLVTETQAWEPLIDPHGQPLPRRAGVSSFGFGGANAHVVVEEYVPQVSGVRRQVSGEYLIVLSARDEVRLREYAQKLLGFVKETLAPSPSEAVIEPQEIKPILQKELVEMVAEIIGVQPAEIEVEQSFEEYGLDQVQLSRLSETVVERYQGELPAMLVSGQSTIMTIADYLRQHQEAFSGKRDSVQALTPNPSPESGEGSRASDGVRVRNLSSLEAQDQTDVSLTELTYTLQVGREAMEVRLALLVDDAADLRDKLSRYLANETDLDGVYQGQLPAQTGGLNLLTEGEEAGDFIGALIKNGKLANLAQLWVSGVDIDWRLLYRAEKPGRISLPVYPFAKERYWIQNNYQLSITNYQLSIDLLHPLVHRNSSDLVEQRYSSTFSGTEFFLKDHQVQGERTLPGTAYLEMARAAGDLALKDKQVTHIRHVVWARPIIIKDGPVETHLSLYPEAADEVTFEVSTIEADGQRVVHAQGSFGYSRPTEARERQVIDLETIRQRCRELKTGETCYRLFEEQGLNYGPGFQVIEDVVSNQEEALGRLRLPDAVATGKAFGLHPSLLDGALQSVIGLVEAQGSTNPRLYLPFSLAEMAILGPLAATGYVYIQLIEAHQDTIHFDLAILDEQGQVCVDIHDFAVKALHRPEQSEGRVDSAASPPEPTSALNANRQERELAQANMAVERPAASLVEIDLKVATETYLTNLFSSILKTDPTTLKRDRTFEHYGIDSLVGIEIVNRLRTDFGPDLSSTILFEYMTIEKLAGYFLNHHLETLQSMPVFQVGSRPKKEAQSGVDPAVIAPVSRSRTRFQISSPALGRERNQAITDIAIIGLSGRYPMAPNLATFWQNLKEGRNCIREIPPERWDYRRYEAAGHSETGQGYSKWGGFIEDIDKFDPLFFNISPREAKTMDPQERLFLETVWATVEDAGYSRTTLAEIRQIGVFVGVMNAGYSRIGAAGSALPGQTNVAYWSIANRVSYIFDWQGPSLAVDTACSSSLTAIHLACESLKRGECKLAIAGGVNLIVHPSQYQGLSAVMMLSADEKCKAFGAGADGFVDGEGVGAVLLKPLAEAIAAGDHIYGVIKGSSMNAGGKTGGYTVPNPNAQTEVILKALAESGVEPNTISYVEAHGTGTALGDPIEIKGLANAFANSSEDRDVCAIGSVKSNIGHLEAAAGIAGLTKVLLQLKYGQLAPSLHAETLNPHIDFEKTPFKVQQELTPWQRPKINVDGTEQEYPRRAGLSSFGAGGANAHLIIEEYKPQVSGVKCQVSGPALFVLSAKNEVQLKTYAEQMLGFIEAEPGISVVELAYTLQVGREALESRLAFLAEDTSAVIDKLAAFVAGEETIEHGYQGRVKRSNDAFDLFTADEDIEAALNNWIKKGKLGKLAELWVKGLDIDWSLLYGAETPARISLPTYPFARERHWISDEQLTISNEQSLASPFVLHPLVHRNISTMAEQRYSSVFSGAEFFLRDHQVQGEKVLPGVAYLEMARAAGELARDEPISYIRNVVWARPIRVKHEAVETHLSLHLEATDEVTFEVSTMGEAGRRVVHARGSLEYSRGIAAREPQRVDLQAVRQRCLDSMSKEQCYQHFKEQGLNYGPAFQVIEEVVSNQEEALARLQLPDEAAGQAYGLHPSLLDGALQSVIGLMETKDAANPVFYLPFELAELEIIGPLPATSYVYVQRLAVRHETLHFNLAILDEEGQVRVKIRDFGVKALPQIDAASEPEPGLYYRPYWQQQALPVPPSESEQGSGDIIIVVSQESREIGERLAMAYPNRRVIRWTLGSETIEHSKTQWDINPADPDGLARSLASLITIDTLYFLGGLSVVGLDPADLKGLDRSQENGVIGLFRLIKILDRQGNLGRLSRLKVMTAQAHQIHAQDDLLPWSAALGGLALSLTREYPAIDVSCIDLELKGDPKGRPLIDERDVEAIVAERGSGGQPVVLREGSRYVRRLASLSLPDIEELPYRPGGVYLILGGAGGIGLETGVYLAEYSQAKLVLVGRSALTQEKEVQLNRIREAGGDYLYCQADGTDLAQMQAVVRQARATFGPLNGVIHSALVLQDGALSTLDEATFRAALAPKITGSMVLYEAVKAEPLDFLLFFSSGQSFWGNAGQANYAAACTFKDAFGLFLRQRCSFPIKVINWGYWGDVGVVASETYRRRLAQQGIHSIRVEEGMTALSHILAGPVEQVAVIKAEPPVLTEIGLELDHRFQVFEPMLAPMMKATITGMTSQAQEILPDEVRLAEERAGFEALEHFARLALLSTLQRMRLLPKSGETQTRSETMPRWNILPKYAPLVEACLTILTQGGYIMLTETEIKATAKVAQAETLIEAEALTQQRDRLHQTYPMVSPHLHLLWTCLESFPAIIRGQVPATDVMFPNSSLELVAGIYQGTPLADYTNRLLALSVKAYVEHRLSTLKPGEKIKMIEVGAGTGGTTQFVLEAIAPYGDRVEYLYTDLSQGFIRHGRTYLGARYPFMAFGLLDIEQHPGSQGYDLNTAEIVLGANVVHATQNVHHALQCLKSLLKAGGLLMLNEATQFTAFTTLTFGLLDGWWLFEDGAKRIEHTPLLSPDQWQRALADEGFRQVHISGLAQVTEQAGGEYSSQNIVLAESDGLVMLLEPSQHMPLSPVEAGLKQPRQQAKEEPAIPVLTDHPATRREAGSTGKFIEHTVTQVVSRVLQIGEEDIEPDVAYTELGIDSILAVEIVNQINSRLQITLRTTDLFNYADIQTLSEHIAATFPEILSQPSNGTSSQEEVVKPGYQEIETLFEPATGQTTGRTNRNQTEEWREVGHQAEDTESETGDPQGLDIAIIGLSGRFPEAGDAETFWQNLASGRDSVRDVTGGRWQMVDFYSPDRSAPYKSYSKWAGLLSDIDQFDPLFFNISPQEAELMDPQQRLFLQEAWKALEDAGYSKTALDGKKCGVFVGCGVSDYQKELDKANIAEAHSFMGNSAAILTARIAYYLNLKGPSISVDTACSSSLVAIHLACESIRSGTSELALAGGVAVLATPHFHILASKTEMLSPQGRCRTFAQGADGFVPGEGVGVIVLKPLRQALADGDHIYGVIKGSGVNQDGKTNGLTAPNGPSQTALEGEVYDKFGLHPETISYVEAHGTGTILGDPIEVDALTDAFRRYTNKKGYCAIGSVKTNIGHTLTAAGVAGVIKVLLALKHKKLPPSLHFEVPNTHIDFENSPFYVNTELQDWPGENGPRRAAVSSFGFSGTNAHLVIEEYIPQVSSVKPVLSVVEGCQVSGSHLIVLSAKNEERLREYAQTLLDFMQTESDISLAELVYTLQVGREAMEARLAWVVEDIEDLQRKLGRYLEDTQGAGGVYQGYLKANKTHPVKLAEGEVTGDFIQALIQQGELSRLAQLWIEGIEIDWSRLYEAEAPRRMSLPTYPFARERYWIPQPEIGASEETFLVKDDRSREGTGIGLYQPAWQPAELKRQTDLTQAKIMVLYHDPEFGEAAQQILEKEEGMQLIRVSLAEAFIETDSSTYQINAQAEDDYLNLFRRLQDDQLEPDYVVYQGHIGADVPDQTNIRQLYCVIKAIKTAQLESVKKIVMLYGGAETEGQPHLEAIGGYTRSLALVGLGLSKIRFDDENLSAEQQISILAAELKDQNDGVFHEVQYRDRQRYVKTVAALAQPGGEQAALKRRGVYWITGGSGGLGMLIARHLAERYQASLVLTGRSALDEAIEAKLALLRESGATQVSYLSGDVADAGQMAVVWATIKSTVGHLNGIIHAAGTQAPALVHQKEWPVFQQVLSPKIDGTVILDELTGAEELDFFALFSSGSALVGDFGQCDYAIGNRFMDEYALLRQRRAIKNERHGKTISINWPLWREGGMRLLPEGESLYLNSSGQRYLETDEGLRLFEAALSSEHQQLIVFCGHTTRINRFLGLESEPSIERYDGRDEDQAIEPARSMLAEAEAGEAGLVHYIVSDVKKLISAITKLAAERIDSAENLGNLGFDSIMLKQLAVKIGDLYGIALMPAVFFEYPNVDKLSGYLIEAQRERMRAYYQKSISTAATKPPAGRAVKPARQPVSTPSARQFNENEAIAIVGISGIMPGSPDLKTFWRHLEAGVSLITEIPPERWDWRDYEGDPQQDHNKTRSKWGGFIPDVDKFDALFF